MQIRQKVYFRLNGDLSRSLMPPTWCCSAGVSTCATVLISDDLPVTHWNAHLGLKRRLSQPGHPPSCCPGSRATSFPQSLRREQASGGAEGQMFALA